MISDQHQPGQAGEGKEMRQEVRGPKELEIDLVEIFFEVLSKVHFIIIAALVGAIIMGANALWKPPMYSATAKLYIAGSQGTTLSVADLQKGSMLTMDYEEVFRTWEVHEMVRSRLGLTDYTYDQMQSMLSVSNPEDTHVLLITANNPDAQLAADLANAYAAAAKEFILQTMDTEGPNVFSVALVPSMALQQNGLMDAAKGSLLAGGLMCIGLVLFFALDDRPRTPEHIRKTAEIPTLAIIPAVSKEEMEQMRKELSVPCLEIGRLPGMDFASEEAFHALATNISCCGSDIKTILVTSRYANEGKTFTSMNLLRTFAGLQKRAVLVDMDLRRSQLMNRYAVRFQGKTSDGLTQYLTGECGAENIICRTNIPNAWMVPVGQKVHNSLQLLSSDRTRKLMDTLRRDFDVVIVDVPPAGMFAEAIEVAKHCDGALIVVGYDCGKRKDISEVAEMIGKTGCRVLGAVLNNVDFRSFICRKHYYRSERYAMYYQKNDGSETSWDQVPKEL